MYEIVVHVGVVVVADVVRRRPSAPFPFQRRFVRAGESVVRPERKETVVCGVCVKETGRCSFLAGAEAQSEQAT